MRRSLADSADEHNKTELPRIPIPSEIISHAVWLYHRFSLSFRDVEDLLAVRGVTVSYETTRRWCRKFGAAYARALKRREGRLGDTWHLDELFITTSHRVLRDRSFRAWRQVTCVC